MIDSRSTAQRLLVLCALFVIKGVFYSLVLPMWEGYDEYAHLAFIQHIALHHTLTLPDTRVSQEIDQSLHLAPVPWELVKLNPSYTSHDQYWRLPAEERERRQAQLRDLPIAYQYTTGEAFLYEGKQAPFYYLVTSPVYALARQTALPTRVLIFRFLNVLIGALILPITFAAGRKTFLNSELAFVAPALIASMPELYIDIARVGNESMAIVFYSAFTLLLLCAVERGSNYLALSGLSLGLLLVSKAYGLAAIPALVFVILCSALTSSRRWRVIISGALAITLAALISFWWYLRNVRLVGSVMWTDGAPDRPITPLEIIRSISRVDWRTAVKSLASSHIWFGDWSFLSVRTWMYQVLEAFALIAAIGLIVLALRAYKQQKGISRLAVHAVVYSSFVASIAYHVLMNFLNYGVGASPGWYLYAVIVPEMILLIAGLFAFQAGRRLSIALIVSFFLLELYTVHWVLIPYYTGIIAHAADGGLRAFHISQLRAIGIGELLARLQINRPSFITAGALITSWLCFLTASVAVVLVCLRSLRRIPESGAMTFSLRHPHDRIEAAAEARSRR